MADGCKLCMAGLKSVLFITGICGDNCFYCPISFERRGRDVKYINEVPASSVKAIVTEITASGSRGVGITGGDPLLARERLLTYIKHLKDVFGREFHIHLYTSGTYLSSDVLAELTNAGLDELRIHVISEASWVAIEKALRYPIDVGIEVPAIPGREGDLMKIITRAESLGVKFINLNELEVSDSNYSQLALMKFRFRDDRPAVVGSEELALKILNWVDESGLRLGVHYCPAVFKDRYQFRRRLARRGLRSKLIYEEVDDGLVRWVRIRGPCDELLRLLPLDIIASNSEHYLLHPKLLKIINLSSCVGEVVEAYPTASRLELNLIPLNEFSRSKNNCK